ncbi:MAG: potassium/proton antiporter, partial [Opitutales bacterium]|nr:potassium/proton antiporter [Opitutales bacterium]
MNFTPDNYLLIFSILLFASILASKASYKIGAPMLLLFLGIGILAGQEVSFENTQTTSLVGELALVFILFAGGLDTKFRDIQPVMAQGVILSTFGVLLTAGLLGGAIYGLSNLPFVAIHFSLAESLLLGSIVSSTDAASVFSIFRSQRTTLKNNLRPMLELESGSNDPMAYVLTVSLTTYLVAQNTGTEVPEVRTAVFQLAVSMGLGGALGYAFGKLMVFVINKAQLYVEGLYPVLVLAMTAFSFAATKMLGGNGFLAVYLAGLILGNANFIHKKALMTFHEGFAWLMQLLLFITLGLFANFAAIKAVAMIGIIISLILIFAVRPLSV